MNNNIKNIYNIANKPNRLVIGLMSGTSLDGLDIALCNISGSGLHTKLELVDFETVAYNEDFRNEIKSVFSKKQVELEKLTLLNPWIALQHASIINACLNKWNIKNEEIDLIASHGQTIYHAPVSLHQQQKFGNATLQIGDGDHLAVATGIITISDFRQKNIAAGGEGAPLAGYGDYLIFGKQNEDRILLNIGGIANFTFLPGSMQLNEIVCTDTGPGNTIMDALIQQHFKDMHFDENASVALQGNINHNLLSALKDDAFFEQILPKTTGPELFNLEYLQKAMQKSSTTELSITDTMATLNKFSADTILQALLPILSSTGAIKIYASGGGMHNPLLMRHLKNGLPNCEFLTTKNLDIEPDAKEAVLFAVLANECICGNGDYLHQNNSEMPAISMGKISFPN